MYDDGLVRIATEDYTEDPAFISDSCIHVCNYDVNHQSEKFINNTHESSRDGHKVLHFLIRKRPGKTPPPAAAEEANYCSTIIRNF